MYCPRSRLKIPTAETKDVISLMPTHIQTLKESSTDQTHVSYQTSRMHQAIKISVPTSCPYRVRSQAKTS